MSAADQLAGRPPATQKVRHRASPWPHERTVVCPACGLPVLLDSRTVELARCPRLRCKRWLRIEWGPSPERRPTVMLWK